MSDSSPLTELGYAPPQERSLLLWGPPGVGKTRCGALVAKELGLPFVDLDLEIATRTGQSAAEWIACSGEPAFREVEARTLREVLARPQRQVIAAGGGTLLHADLRALAHQRAVVFSLVAPAETLEDRLRNDATARPLLAAGLGTLLSSRAQAYAKSGHHVVSADNSPESVCHAIVRGALETVATVALPEQAYAARFFDREQLLGEIGLPHTRLVVVIDQTLAELDPTLLTSLDQADAIVQHPGGEPGKSSANLVSLLQKLLELGCDRESLLVAVGGGALSDVSGLAAALFMRKIRWISVPTTLLAMSDAALGGKTAINLAATKNPVGAFHHPEQVLIDVSFCRTQSDREYRAGLAEVVKCALLAGPVAFAELESRALALTARDPVALRQVVSKALSLKAAVVEADPEERGCRAWLNLGHTLGHALESQGGLLHGEAVSIGTVAALRLGERLSITAPGVADRTAQLLATLGLPTECSSDQLQKALPALARDKKRSGEQLRWVLIRQLGQPCIISLGLAEAHQLLFS